MQALKRWEVFESKTDSLRWVHRTDEAFLLQEMWLYARSKYLDLDWLTNNILELGPNRQLQISVTYARRS